MTLSLNAASLQKNVTFEGIHCRLTVSKPARGVCVAKFSGPDVDEFGNKPLDLLSGYLAEWQSMRLFVDARETASASVDVSNRWAQWMHHNKQTITEIHLLCGSRFIHFTANFARKFSGIEEKMRIYTDADAFTFELGRAVNESAPNFH